MIEIKKIATVLGQRLTDLKAFRLAAWAEHMEAQIEKEDHQETLAIIGDRFEWLQSLRLNPELTFENKPVIERGDDQKLQPDVVVHVHAAQVRAVLDHLRTGQFRT